MKYIVYREQFIMYDKPHEGYFVCYGDKCSDVYSDKWFKAKQYTTIKHAINRLGLPLPKVLNSFDQLIELRKKDMDVKWNRNDKIDNVLGNKKSPEDIFKTMFRGRIEIVDEDNNYVGNAVEEVIKFYHDLINKSKKSRSKQIDGPSNYIVDTKEDEDFWDGF